MSCELIILGTIGNCLDILETLEACNLEREEPLYRFLGFLDDDPSRQGKEVLGFPVLGPLERAGEFPEAHFLNGIGSPASYRKKPALLERTGVPRERWARLVHPRSHLSPRCQVGPGTVVLAGVTIGYGARLGAHVVVLPGCVVNHDATLGDYTILAGGVVVSGGVQVGENCYLGAGSVIHQQRVLGDRCLVGLGAVVLHDVAADTVVVGNPARVLRSGRE